MSFSRRITRSALHAAKQFDPIRARYVLEELWSQVRTMDTPSVQRGAEVLIKALRAAGIENATLVSFPADGLTEAGGWLAPVTWQVESACLTLANDPAHVLANFAEAPQSLAMFSPPTPHGEPIEGEVLILTEKDLAPDALSRTASRFTGRFLLVPPGVASPRFNMLAAEHRALAVLATSPGPLAESHRYLNYAVPLAADAPCVPCFALSPACAADLRDRLAVSPTCRLRAQVRCVRTNTGTIPMVTGSVGRGNSVPVCIYGHMDEPGANDNASGCATAVEALRVLQQCVSDPVCPQQRPIRFFFSTELRGMQIWLNQQARQPVFAPALNLDMTAGDPTREPCTLRIGGGFQHRPNFGRRVMEEALRLADRVTPCPCERKLGSCVLGDSAVIGIHDMEGAVSIEQSTGPSYHTNMDTPERLIGNPMLHWSGAAATAYLHLMSRMDNMDLADLAETVRSEAIEELRSGASAASVAAKRAVIELETIKHGTVPVSFFNGWKKPEDYYAAGVSRRTGRWPALAAQERIEGCMASLQDAIQKAKPPAAPKASQPPNAWRAEADQLVPLALFRGPLCFEDQWRTDAHRQLSERTGLDVGWGTETWAWRLCTFFRGRQTLTEIIDELAGIGINTDPLRAIQLTRLLTDLGKVRLRPIITAPMLREVLTTLGIRRGSILMVHAGLSRFGYVLGGPATVIETLREVLGPEGTLVMPTHSLNVLGAAPFDPQLSPSTTGAVTEYFRRLPGVLRSAHPTHSVAALGPAADELTRGHRATQAPLDRHGFWGRLYDRNGDVLLLCPIRSCTIFHAGETWADLPLAPLIAHVATASGGRRTVSIPKGPWHVEHFESTMAEPLLAKKIMRQAQLGDAPVYFGPARAMANMSVDVNRQNPMVSIAKDGQCACFYCAVLRDNLAAAKKAK